MIQRLHLSALLVLACSFCFAQSRFITVDNTKIRINTIGTEDRREGHPVIVFESGHGTPMGHWDKILKGVSALAPVVTYDRPGIGESEPDDEMPTIKNVSDRLISILNYLNLKPPYVLVGHSLGGAYLRGFAVYYPEMLAGLVIIDPADFTETQENRRLPLLDIGMSDYTIDTLIAKWARQAMENKLKDTRPISVQEEGEVVLPWIRVCSFIVETQDI